MSAASNTASLASLYSGYHRYRTTTNVNLPFRVHPIVEEIGKSSVEYSIHIKANFDGKLNANNVVLKIPTPLNTTKVDCKVQIGKAKYIPGDNHILWKSVIAVATVAKRLSTFLKRQDPSIPRNDRNDLHGSRFSLVYHTSKSLVAATHQSGFPSAHVYIFWVNGQIPEGLCKRRVFEREMGQVSHGVHLG